jgi:predicted ATPase/class 3 adenylate cyclase
MEQTHSFGYWLRRRRKALDLTQAELARQANCSVALIQKIETDARRPSRQLAELLAASLGLVAEERAAFVQAARAERAVGELRVAAEPVSVEDQALPHGTLTFLFTDIAGSARLWERNPQHMEAALLRHDQLLRAAIARHGGAVFKTVGDGVYAVFTQAHLAVAAALWAQQHLREEPWQLYEPPQVRMAIHSGPVEPVGGDYFGPVLNRTARLLAAGHGGQVLLSLAAEELAREQLPPGAHLQDLGIHRLKDLSLPERIFQLSAENLPATFPALRTLDSSQSNLPAQPTALIGREQDVAAVVMLLRGHDARLLTLTGPGGVGKTRLALQAAAELLDSFPDGVYFVDLASVREPEQLAPVIAQALGVGEANGRNLLSSLRFYLADKQQLLVLDNFEQVLDGAPIVASLLATAPRLKVLITSRERLRLRGEHEQVVATLALPERATLPLDQLSQYAAVTLFIERARAAHSRFLVTNATAPAVAEICMRLDGLPLAIELAAARAKLFSPQALLARLSSRLNLLTGGQRDLPARQQTLRSTIAWSYELLNDAEQRLFRRLGIFVGGCTIEAAIQICGAPGQLESELLDAIEGLIDRSLLRHSEMATGVRRIQMLETIREFALEQLTASGQLDELRGRHTGYYLTLAEQEIVREDGSEDDQALKALVFPEYDNLLEALEWNRTTAGDLERAVRLANAMTMYWFDQALRREAIGILERIVDHPAAFRRTAAFAWGYFNLAQFLGLTGNFEAARARFEQALEVARELELKWMQSLLLTRIGWVAREQGSSAAAWSILNDSMAIAREVEEEYLMGTLLNTTAGVAILDEDAGRAEALLEQCRALMQGVMSDNSVDVWTLNHLGHAAQLRGDFALAMHLHRESLNCFTPSFHAAALWAYHGLGESALGLGELEEAASWLAQALDVSRVADDLSGRAWCLASFGSLAALSGRPERAATLWGAAELLRTRIGARTAPAVRATYERAQAIARGQLDAETFAAAWAAGERLSPEQAYSYALGEEG